MIMILTVYCNILHYVNDGGWINTLGVCVCWCVYVCMCMCVRVCVCVMCMCVIERIVVNGDLIVCVWLVWSVAVFIKHHKNYIQSRFIKK